MKKETKCTVCGTTENKLWMMCSTGTYCSDCQKDIQYALTRELMSAHTVAYLLAEMFFRKAKGEKITFKELWEKHLPKGLSFREIVEKINE